MKTVSIAYETLPEEEKGEDAEIVAVSIVEDFAKCPLLTELELRIRAVPEKSARIVEACRAFRGRAVQIFIGGKQYGS